MPKDEHSVYMNGNNGPFKCSNCEYYTGPNTCEQENIIELAGEGKFGLSLDKNGNARVDPDGCSDYFEPQSFLEDDDYDEEDEDEEN